MLDWALRSIWRDAVVAWHHIDARRSVFQPMVAILMTLSNYVSVRVEDSLESIGDKLLPELEMEFCFACRDAINAVGIKFHEDEVCKHLTS